MKHRVAKKVQMFFYYLQSMG